VQLESTIVCHLPRHIHFINLNWRVKWELPFNRDHHPCIVKALNGVLVFQYFVFSILIDLKKGKGKMWAGIFIVVS
jgi:hypothetical protein